MSDLEIVQRRIDKIIKLARSGDKDSKIELDILERVKVHLEQGKMVRSMDLTKEEGERVKKYF